MTIIESWNKESTPPRPYCHFLNLIAIYKNIIIKAITAAKIADLLMSSAIVGPTFWVLINPNNFVSSVDDVKIS